MRSAPAGATISGGAAAPEGLERQEAGKSLSGLELMGTSVEAPTRLRRQLAFLAARKASMVRSSGASADIGNIIRKVDAISEKIQAIVGNRADGC
jgi:hypothetical protein